MSKFRSVDFSWPDIASSSRQKATPGNLWSLWSFCVLLLQLMLNSQRIYSSFSSIASLDWHDFQLFFLFFLFISFVLWSSNINQIAFSYFPLCKCRSWCLMIWSIQMLKYHNIFTISFFKALSNMWRFRNYIFFT